MKLSFLRTLLVGSALTLAISAVHAADSAKPRPPLDGTWRWDFVMPDSSVARPTLRVKTENDGKLTGTARFRSGSSTSVKNFKLAGDQVSFDVERERDDEKFVTHYRGTLHGDKITGKITTKWTGDEQSYDWLAVRFSDIEGVWKWRPSFGTNAPGGGQGGGQGQGGGRRGQGGGRGGFGEVSATFKREEGDVISGKVNAAGRDQDIKHGLIKDGEISFQTVRERSTGEMSTNWYWGRLNGDNLTGKYTTDLGGERRTNEWRAARGD
jgi:hypothetical protein